MMHLTLVLLATGVAPPVPLAASRAQKENLPNWPTRFELRKVAAMPGTLVGVVVPPEVFGKSSSGLSDLRLIDAGGSPIPYALRIRSLHDKPEVLPGTSLNAGVRPDGTLECSIDLGPKPGEHSQVYIPLQGTSYHRPVRIEGSDDGTTWNRIREGVHLVNLEERGQVIDRRRFEYFPSRYRYLRVQVGPDLRLDPVAPKLESIQISRQVHVPAVTDAYRARLVRTEPGRYQGAYARSTLIDLDAERVPASGLRIDVDERAFSRPYTLETESESGLWQTVGSGTIEPDPDGGSIALSFPETTARRLRLRVIDASNSALTIRDPRFMVVRREILFRLPAEAKTPLYFYTGSPSAQPPDYDFATQLPLDATAAATATVGMGEANPEYVALPVAWSEQHPRLIDGVLGFAGVVLAGILAALARAAIRRQGTPAAA